MFDIDEEEVFLAILGNALLEGRKLHKSDKAFGKFCSTNFPNLVKQVTHHEIPALLWAAEFPEKRQEMSEKYPRVRTICGLYAEWMEEIIFPKLVRIEIIPTDLI